MLNKYSLIGAVLLMASGAQAEPLWQSLPPTPKITNANQAFVDVGGARIFYEKAGEGPAVVLLHGGPANANYLADQFKALKKSHTVIAIDTRGHGKSSFGTEPLTYDRMADDVIRVLDDAKVAKAAIVGWSDGAITGLDLAIRHADRVTKVFAFAANTNTEGVKPGADKNPVWMAFENRAETEYNMLAPKGSSFARLHAALDGLYAKEPNWTDDDLRKITVPVVVADGDHDEIIKRTHTEYIARTIPGAALLILPNTSHFAFLQDPALFNAAVENFLNM